MANEKEDRLKILHGMDVYLPDVDGVVTCMDNYCRVLQKRADVTAAVPKNCKNYIDDFPYKIKRCKSFKFPIINMYYGRPNADRKFKKELYESEFDIVHVHSPFNMGKFVLKLARKKNIPAVATFHSNFRPIFKKVVKFKFLSEFMVRRVGKFYSKFDEVFVCSPAIEQQLRSFGFKGKVSFMPFGTNTKKVSNSAEFAARANKKFNIGANEAVFLFVGRLTELKRVDFIIDSLKILKDWGEKFRFYIVGKGYYENNLRSQIKKLGLSENEVIFTGFINDEDRNLLYARADLFLFPSLFDTFGLVKVEAAAFSTPCVLINGSASASGTTDNVNAFLSADTREAFAQRIKEALADKAMLKKIGQNATRDLYYSWSDCAKYLITKYNEIISEKTNIK